MSFAAEMDDFYKGFAVTSNATSRIRAEHDKNKNTFDFDKAKAGAPDKFFGPGAEEDGTAKKSSGSKGYTPPTGKIKSVIDNNVPPEWRDYAYKMAYHETGGTYDPSIKSPTGATGLFQFTKGTGKDYGLIGQNGDMRSDPNLNTQAFVKYTLANQDALKKALGREPTLGELAIAHQQGAGGATYLLTGKAPKNFDMAQFRQNLKVNNVKDPKNAAQKIASFYGFDLNKSPSVKDTSAIPTDYTQWDQPDDSQTADAAPDDSSGDASYQPRAKAGQGDLLAGSRNAMNEVDYAIPDGARRYAAGDLTTDPQALSYQSSLPVNTMMAAEGGSVPWADEVSHVVRRRLVPTYRTPQTYGALADLPDVADGGKKPHLGNGTNGSGYGSGMGMGPNYYTKNTETHGNPALTYPGAAPNPNTNMFGNIGGGGFKKPAPVVDPSYATGGAIPGVDDTNNPDAVQTAPLPPAAPAPAPQAVPTAPAAPVTPPSNALPPPPAGNPRGSNREALAMEQRQAPRDAHKDGGATIGQVIDAGLKHLTSALGLDKSGAAIGNDPNIQAKQAKLINGAIAPGEGPPTPQEVQGIYKVIDPNGELSDSLKSVYAMKKGYDFYMTHGQPEKAAKFAAGIIQYSNLMSKRYGYAAVQAGQNGDVAGMTQYAIKAYDNIPDGLTVEAAQGEGGNVNVTRKDEDGNVIDQHQLTPQQIFQMATGISKGSGYFETLMEQATPGTAAEKAKERKATTRAGNLDKLYPSIQGELDDSQQEAWQSAAETGDYETMTGILKDVKKAHDDATKEERQTEQWKRMDDRLQQTIAATADRQQKGFDHQDQAASDRETSRTKHDDEVQARKDKADEDKRSRSVKVLDKTFAANKRYLDSSEQDAWKDAVADNDLDSLKILIKSAQDRARNTYYDPSQLNLTPPPASDGSDADAPAAPAPASQTAIPEAGAATVTSGGKPLAPADLAKAKAAIAKGAKAEDIKSYLAKQGFSTEGL